MHYNPLKQQNYIKQPEY